MDALVRAARAANAGPRPDKWLGRIHAVPDGGRVEVVVPDQHPTRTYLARIAPDFEAGVGDECLICFDNRGNPWVVSYAPAA